MPLSFLLSNLMVANCMIALNFEYVHVCKSTDVSSTEAPAL